MCFKLQPNYFTELGSFNFTLNFQFKSTILAYATV